MQSLWKYCVTLVIATVAHGYLKCQWDNGCIRYPETFCYQLTGSNESQCKGFIDNGQPCCLGGPDQYYGYSCFNTSYDGPKVNVHSCLTMVKQCDRRHYIPLASKPVNQSCQAYAGNLLGNQVVNSELQCMDLCMRDTRCNAYNIQETVNGIDCQLLGIVDNTFSCNTGYTGKLFDRTAFHKAYLRVDHECF